MPQRSLRQHTVVRIERKPVSQAHGPYQVRIPRLAAREYQVARTWYETRLPGLGQAFQDEVDRGIDKIAGDPYQWPIYRGPYHWLRLRRFPYLLYYQVLGDKEVIILAVAHGRRRKGYWRRRKPS